MAENWWQERSASLYSIGLPAYIACLAMILLLEVAIVRLWFSPLARIPGPRLAALTGLYEFYYDCILGGKYIFEIEKMHQRYGPIVRISPREVHVNDPEYYNQLYSVTNKLRKDWQVPVASNLEIFQHDLPNFIFLVNGKIKALSAYGTDRWYYRFVGSSDAGFGTANPDLHRARRKAMSRFFSQSAISSLEESVNECVQRLCERIKEHGEANTPVNLSNAFRCLAGDIVSQYSLPEGLHHLDSGDFADSYNRQARTISHIAVWNRHLGFIIPLFLKTPRWVVVKMATKGGIQAFDFQANLRQQASNAVHGERGKTTEKGSETILQGIMDSELPPSDKTVDRLYQEALTVVGAGTETTGCTLDTITYYVLSNHQILRKLKVELAGSFPHQTDPISFEAARRLPYLSGIVSEGLRLAVTVSGRLARSNPTAQIVYGSYALAPGTVVSMTIRDLHTSPTIYPDPARFIPERWIDPNDRKRLEAYHVPFSRGSRSCIGKDLAMVELYLAVANLFRRFDMNLFETTKRDISMEHDFFAPFGPSESKGLQVLVQ